VGLHDGHLVGKTVQSLGEQPLWDQGRGEPPATGRHGLQHSLGDGMVEQCGQHVPAGVGGDAGGGQVVQGERLLARQDPAHGCGGEVCGELLFVGACAGVGMPVPALGERGQGVIGRVDQPCGGGQRCVHRGVSGKRRRPEHFVVPAGRGLGAFEAAHTAPQKLHHHRARGVGDGDVPACFPWADVAGITKGCPAWKAASSTVGWAMCRSANSMVAAYLTTTWSSPILSGPVRVRKAGPKSRPAAVQAA
jgi:hypothetical protein